MVYRILVGIAACLLFASNTSAITFTVKPDSGVILVWQQSKGSWTAVKDSALVKAGDSLYLDDQYHAKLFLGKGCVVLLRGELRANLAGSDTALVVHLDAGQLFLKRDPGADLANVKAVLHGCAFTPVGTAVSIKFTRQGEPTAAVLAGRVRIEPSKGESVVVLPGTFCTYDPVLGSFKEGKLPPEAIASLESWSGVKLDMASASAVPDTAKQAAKDTAQKAAQPAAQQPAPAAVQASPQPAAAQPVAALPQKQAVAGPEAQAKKEETPAPDVPAAATPAKKEEKPIQPARQEKKEQPQGQANGAPRITWELSAGSVTVNNQQWSRLAISPDISIWKFGIALDLELFLDGNGDFSDKGWNFDHDDWAESLMRKIRYLRFGYENDPVFVKVGGLSSVTLGYGFVVDRFTNMLHYPDQKLLGMQFNLNNVSPVAITLQTMVSDFLEFKYKGGIVAARLALCPLKPSGVPVLSTMSIGATYGVDLNEYAPARSWSSASDPRSVAYWRSKYPPTVVNALIAGGDADTTASDTTYRDSTSRYALFAGDIDFPIIKTDFLGLDIYGQAAVVADTAAFKKTPTGWGIGAPGVALRLGPVNAGVEYRHIRGRFIPGYFDEYYLDEQLQRYPVVETKSQSVADRDLDGAFGQLGFNIVNVVLINGSYQYLTGKNNQKDQRFEIAGGLGDALLKRIPKITKAEIYLDKRDIGSTVMNVDSAGKISYDAFFDPTPSFYYGYRIGIAITPGASIILDTRFGYQWDVNHNLIPNNNVTLQTAITF